VRRVEAKLCVGPDGAETFLLVRSAKGQQKERAMHARFAARIEIALVRLEGRLARAQQPVDRGATERQIGRLLGANSGTPRIMRSGSSRRRAG